MTDLYEPSSDFLRAVLAGNVRVSGDEFAANLRKLIATTEDGDRANRDWATFLLAQQPVDTPDVRAALIKAAYDSDGAVRAEAILGLAQRDPLVALPYIQAELSESVVYQSTLEAAELAAHPSLVDGLLGFMNSSDKEWMDKAVAAALGACRKAHW